MAPKESTTRRTRPDDPDKDPWTRTQVTKAYGVHTERAAKKGVEPATKERWMAVKGLEAAEVVTGKQLYRAVDRRCECENCKGEGPVPSRPCTKTTQEQGLVA